MSMFCDSNKIIQLFHLELIFCCKCSEIKLPRYCARLFLYMSSATKNTPINRIGNFVYTNLPHGLNVDVELE